MGIFHRIADKVQDVVGGIKEAASGLKEAAVNVGTAITTTLQSCGESVKGVLSSAGDMMKAVATGDMKGLATACLDLASNISSLATAPMDAAMSIGMSLVQQAMAVAAKAVGKEDSDLFQKIMDGVNTATSFKDLAQPATLLQEAAAKATGQQGPIESAVSQAKDFIKEIK